MDINCSIISDLLPIYIEGMCSDSTKKLVEVHLECCEDCRETYRRMTADPVPEITELAQDEKADSLPRREKPLNAKKVIKKIRRRWIALLLAIVLLIPVGMLTVNQILGTGLSYTAIPRVLEVDAFMSAIKNEEFERAFSYIDIEGIFYGYAATEYSDFSQHPLSQYQRAEIDGRMYYVTEEICQNEYAQYRKDNDAVEFWFNLLQYYESRHDIFFLFPEEMMAEFESKIAGDEDLSFLENFLQEFCLSEGVDGNYYVGATSFNMAELTMERFTENDMLELYPAFYYNQTIQKTKENIAAQNAYANQYVELGLEAYTELSKTVFVENLESIASEGYKFDGYRLSDITSSRVNGKEHFQITYAIDITKDGVPITGASIYISCTSDGISFTGCMGMPRIVDQLRDVDLVRTYYFPWETE